MKKRILTMLMVVVMVFSMFSGIGYGADPVGEGEFFGTDTDVYGPEGGGEADPQPLEKSSPIIVAPNEGDGDEADPNEGDPTAADPSPTEFRLEGVTLLSGAALEAGQFEFAVALKSGDEGGVIGLPTDNVKNDAYGKIYFGTLTFTKAGEYVFEIYEVPTGAAGVAYDASVYIVTIVVTDNGGALNAAETVMKLGSEDAQDVIVFENIYNASAVDPNPVDPNPVDPNPVDPNEGDPNEEITNVIDPNGDPDDVLSNGTGLIISINVPDTMTAPNAAVFDATAPSAAGPHMRDPFDDMYALSAGTGLAPAMLQAAPALRASPTDPRSSFSFGIFANEGNPQTLYDSQNVRDGEIVYNVQFEAVVYPEYTDDNIVNLTAKAENLDSRLKFTGLVWRQTFMSDKLGATVTLTYNDGTTAQVVTKANETACAIGKEITFANAENIKSVRVDFRALDDTAPAQQDGAIPASAFVRPSYGDAAARLFDIKTELRDKNKSYAGETMSMDLSFGGEFYNGDTQICSDIADPQYALYQNGSASVTFGGADFGVQKSGYFYYETEKAKNGRLCYDVYLQARHSGYTFQSSGGSSARWKNLSIVDSGLDSRLRYVGIQGISDPLVSTFDTNIKLIAHYTDGRWDEIDVSRLGDDEITFKPPLGAEIVSLEYKFQNADNYAEYTGTQDYFPVFRVLTELKYPGVDYINEATFSNSITASADCYVPEDATLSNYKFYASCSDAAVGDVVLGTAPSFAVTVSPTYLGSGSGDQRLRVKRGEDVKLDVSVLATDIQAAPRNFCPDGVLYLMLLLPEGVKYQSAMPNTTNSSGQIEGFHNLTDNLKVVDNYNNTGRQAVLLKSGDKPEQIENSDYPNPNWSRSRDVYDAANHANDTTAQRLEMLEYTLKVTDAAAVGDSTVDAYFFMPDFDQYQPIYSKWTQEVNYDYVGEGDVVTGNFDLSAVNGTTGTMSAYHYALPLQIAEDDNMHALLRVKGNLQTDYTQYGFAEAMAPISYEFTITNKSTMPKTALTALDILPGKDTHSVSPKPNTLERAKRYGDVAVTLTKPIYGLSTGYTAYYSTETVGNSVSDVETFADDPNVWKTWDQIADKSEIKAFKVVMESATLPAGESITFYMDAVTPLVNYDGNLINTTGANASTGEVIQNDFAVKTTGGFTYGNSEAGYSYGQEGTTTCAIVTYKITGQIFYDLDEDGVRDQKYSDGYDDVATEQTVVWPVDASGNVVKMPDGRPYPAVLTRWSGYPASDGNYNLTVYRPGTYGIKVENPPLSDGFTTASAGADEYNASHFENSDLDYAYSSTGTITRKGTSGNTLRLNGGYKKDPNKVVPYEFTDGLSLYKDFYAADPNDPNSPGVELPITQGQFKFKLTRVASTNYSGSYSPLPPNVTDNGGKLEIGGTEISVGDAVSLETDASVVTTDSYGTSISTKIPTGAVTVYAPGTYVLQVEEVAGTDPDITYNVGGNSMYIVITAEYIGYANSAINAYMQYKWSNGFSAQLGGSEYNGISPFVNMKNLSDNVELTGTKTLDGAAPSATDKFNFEIALSKGDSTGFTGLTNGTATVQNDQGTIKFPKLAFTKAGTYEFTVREIAGSVPGLTYDGTVYTVTIEVTDGGSGTLKATKTITKSGATGTVKAITFANTYAPNSVPVPLKGTKTLSGATLAA
ncbi:MAG: hypothetical protein IKI49_04230, partial [Oscillospiraceae bacterium]|nr:hypothetical protein [Oscillospiraceae bacterium]